MSLSKAVFNTGAADAPYLNLESTGFLGYTGMRHRLSLPDEDGVLFSFDHADFYLFWMDGVRIPLDIIYIDREHVVDIVEWAEPMTTYPIVAKAEASAVVEANGGWCSRNGVIIGTGVTFQGFR